MKNNIKVHSKLLDVLISFLILLMIGCGQNSDPGGEGGGSTEIGNPVIQGVVQKGPFIKGTKVTIQDLNRKDLSTANSIFISQTKDDIGSFQIFETIGGDGIIEAETEGYYFNEVTGTLSSSRLTLKALSDISSGYKVNVNVLTTLSVERIRYLVTEKNFSFTDANTLAREEILKIFKIPESIISSSNSFEQMDISSQGESHAILLAVSVILQWDHTVEELQALIADISDDIVKDGILDDSKLVDTIEKKRSAINSETIRNNLQDRFFNLGVSAIIPEFEVFLDSDGDAVINILDRPKATLSEQKIANQELAITNGHAAVVFQDKLFIIGGENKSGKSEVWYLAENDTFQIATDNAPWAGRNRHTATVFKDRIWVFGGTYNDKSGWSTFASDSWSSEDGVTWTYAGTPFSLPLSGAQAFVFKDQLWIIGGNAEHDEGDIRPSPYIWHSEDGWGWEIGMKINSLANDNLSSVWVREISTNNETETLEKEQHLWVVSEKAIYWGTSLPPKFTYSLPTSMSDVRIFPCDFSENGLAFFGKNEANGSGHYSILFSRYYGDWEKESVWNGNEALTEPQIWPSFDASSFLIFRDEIWVIDEENRIWTISIESQNEKKQSS